MPDPARTLSADEFLAGGPSPAAPAPASADAFLSQPSGASNADAFLSGQQPAKQGFWSDFGTASGGAWGIATAFIKDSIPSNLVKGAIADPKTYLEAGIPGLVYKKVEAFLAQPDSKPLSERLRDSFGTLVKTVKERPGLAAGAMVHGLAADPELFVLPGMSELGATEAAAGAARAAGAGEGLAAGVGTAAGTVAKVGSAAAIGGGSELASEIGEDRPLDPGAIATSGLIAAPFGLVQVSTVRQPKLTPEEIADVLATHPTGTPRTQVVPVADGYALQVEGRATGVTFPDKAAAEAQAKVINNMASAYRSMDAVPRGTRASERQRFIHENPFTPEKMAEMITRPDKDVRMTGAQLARFWGKAASAAAIGAGIGAYLDRDEPGTGAAFGAAITLLPRALPKDTRVSIEEAINTRNGLISRMARRTFQFKSAIDQAVPEPMRRTAISLALENTPGVTLNPAELKVAASVRQFFDAMGATAQDAGVLKELLTNYVSHIVEEDPKAKAAGVIDKLVDAVMQRGSAQPKSGKQFAKHRKYATFFELNTALRGSGLKIKTSDIGEIVAIYSNAMFRSVTDKRLLDALKAQPVEGMKPMVIPAAEAHPPMPSGDPALERQPIDSTATPTLDKLPPPSTQSVPTAAPDLGTGRIQGPGQDEPVGPPGEGPPGGVGGFQLPPDPGPQTPRIQKGPRMLVQPQEHMDSDYVVMPNRQLTGYAVHKDIAPQLNFAFSARDPNDVTLGLMALSQASKRAIISFSAFHAKSLTDAFIGAMGTRALTSGKPLVDAALKAYLKGGNNDGIDALLAGGLRVQVPEDAATDALQGTLDRVAATIDKVLPVSAAGTAAKGIAKFNSTLDKFTFQYLQTGFKLATGLDALERLTKKGLPREQAAKLAASYANDIYGSLDWFRVASDVTSRIGRDVVYGFFNPNGRRWTQLLMFAPDWTISTFRAAYKALPGAVDDPALTALHRRYIAKSAIYYLTVANGINLVTAGHSIFENENPTRIQLKDGRTMQFSKHFAEPFEWLRDPMQTAGNKLAFLPRTSVELLTGKEYISAHDSAPDIENRAQLVADSFLPISAQQGLAGGGAQSVLGLVGMPIYGKDPQEKIEARKAKKVAAAKKKQQTAAYFRRLNANK